MLETNDLSIMGRFAAVDVNDTKRARYCQQVAVCAIYMKVKDTYYQSESDLLILEWLQVRAKMSEMWF